MMTTQTETTQEYLESPVDNLVKGLNFDIDDRVLDDESISNEALLDLMGITAANNTQLEVPYGKDGFVPLQRLTLGCFDYITSAMQKIVLAGQQLVKPSKNNDPTEVTMNNLFLGLNYAKDDIYAIYAEAVGKTVKEVKKQAYLSDGILVVQALSVHPDLCVTIARFLDGQKKGIFSPVQILFNRRQRRALKKQEQKDKNN